jgi:hypothetical protein
MDMGQVIDESGASADVERGTARQALQYITFNANVTVTILDIVHCPDIYLKHKD